MDAWRSAAETMLCWPFGTYARALRIKLTRQRCQEAPTTRRIAAFHPSCASEVAGFTPYRPRAMRLSGYRAVCALTSLSAPQIWRMAAVGTLSKTVGASAGGRRA